MTPQQLPGGPNTIAVSYLGDSNYTSGSGSTAVNLFVSLLITFVPYPQNVAANQPLALTITVGGIPSFGTPTGTVTLSRGTYTSSPAQLTAGSASFTIPADSLAIGEDTLTASYSGDTNYNALTGSAYFSVTATPSLTIAGTSVTVIRGAASGNTSTITLTPGGGFTGSVALTAAVTSSPTGAQYLPGLSFGTTSLVGITGANAATATLTISTTAATTAALAHHSRPGVPWYVAGSSVLACILLFGIPARRRKWRITLGMVVLLVAFCGGVLSCGGGGGAGGGNSIPGTTAGVYTITVAGTSGTTAATGTFVLTVQ